MKIWHEIIIALAVLLLVFLVRKFLSNLIFKAVKKIFPNTFLSNIPTLEGPLQRHLSCMVMILFMMLILRFFTFSRHLQAEIWIGIRLILVLATTLVASDILDIVFKIFAEKASIENRAMGGLLRFYARVGKICLWAIFFILSVKLCGFSISGLLATFGIGGAALALAAKDSLANFFGSISLISDRVFKVGETIKFGDEIEGVVEDIGLRSTRIRTPAKSLIIVPNSILANSRIDNLSYIRGRFVSQKLFFDNTVSSFKEAGDFVNGALADLRSYTQINSPTVPLFDSSREGLQITFTYVIPQKNCSNYFDIRSEVNRIIFENVQRSKLNLASTGYHFTIDQSV